MSGKVVSLAPGNNPNEPFPDLVETLERLLEEARSGELRGMAYATVRTGDRITVGWDGAAGTRDPLSTAISMLEHRYTSKLLENRMDDNDA